jgi:hypothetical protein
VHQAAEGYRLAFTLVNATNGCYECCESLDVSCVDSFAVQDASRTAWPSGCDII